MHRRKTKWRDTRRGPWEGQGMQLWAKDGQQVNQKLGPWHGTFSPAALSRNQPCRHLNFRLAASRAVRWNTSALQATQFMGLCTAAPGNENTKALNGGNSDSFLHRVPLWGGQQTPFPAPFMSSKRMADNIPASANLTARHFQRLFGEYQQVVMIKGCEDARSAPNQPHILTSVQWKQKSPVQS